MKGDKQVIYSLNKCLAVELIAINQYFLHARILKNMGVDDLGKVIYRRSIKLMKEADDLVERILLLEGLPNLQDLGKLLIGETVEEILACDGKLESTYHQSLVDAMVQCELSADYVSRDLLESIKDHNEEHWDWLGTQEDLIVSMGLGNYLQRLS